MAHVLLRFLGPVVQKRVLLVPFVYDFTAPHVRVVVGNETLFDGRTCPVFVDRRQLSHADKTDCVVKLVDYDTRSVELCMEMDSRTRTVHTFRMEKRGTNRHVEADDPAHRGWTMFGLDVSVVAKVTQDEWHPCNSI